MCLYTTNPPERSPCSEGNVVGTVDGYGANTETVGALLPRERYNLPSPVLRPASVAGTQRVALRRTDAGTAVRMPSDGLAAVRAAGTAAPATGTATRTPTVPATVA